MPDPIDALPTPPSRSDTPATFIARANAFIAALVNFVTQTNAVATAMNLNSTSGTSASSNSIGTGAKTFTADTGKSWLPGMFIVIADTAAPSTNSMLAQITSYNSTTGALVVDVKSTLGSGTKTAWTISQTANPVPLDGSVSYSSLSASAKASIISATYSDVSRAVPVRQTVLTGPVDSSGLPSFGGSTGGTTVTMSGTLEVTAANGSANRTGSGTNPSWTGLSTNGTMYLYADVNADGTLSQGAGTLAPSYQWGGTYSTTNGQFTFNIQEMTGKVGNGTTAAQTYRVYVGEVTVAGGVVTAITWYALQGRYVGTVGSSYSASTAYTFNHNLGVIPGRVDAVVQNITTEAGWAVGDEVDLRLKTYSVGRKKNSCIWSSDTNSPNVNNANAGGNTNITAANWKPKLYVYRGW